MSDPAPELPPAERRFDWDRIIGLSALLTSIATIAFLAYQAFLMRIQVEAATWPYVQIIETCCAQGLSISVQNKGTGPAILKVAVVKVDGKPHRNWVSVLTALTGEPPPALDTSSLVRRVMDSGETATLLRVSDPAYAARIHAEFVKGRVVATACYCSVLDKCWLAVPTRESLEVPACPQIPPAQAFAQ